ncbi:MAG TPA: hypothetical protein VMB05_18210 [Solirubrobacteraceae bacterium]|nr:hypothetical protein [Solirubrobacteraceae bacterium]
MPLVYKRVDIDHAKDVSAAQIEITPELVVEALASLPTLADPAPGGLAQEEQPQAALEGPAVQG